MNRDETLQILSIMRAAYPTFYRSMSGSDYQDTALLWENMFAEDSFQLVGAAVKAFIATDEKGYPPHVGAIKAQIAKLTTGVRLTEAEAWVLVKNAMSAYATHEDFLALPPPVRRAVGGSSQLVQWALSDSSALPVIMSNFMRSYRAAADAEDDMAKMPADVKRIMGVNQLALNHSLDTEGD